MEKPSGISTTAIHGGEDLSRAHGSVIPPIYQSSTFEYGGQSSYHDIKYIRLNNTPNHQTLHSKLEQLEGAEQSLVTSSGMASISSAILGVLENQGHLLAQKTLYGGTYAFITQDIGRWGHNYDFFDPDNMDNLESLLKENTRAIYVEAMTNPNLEVPDFKRILNFAKKHNLVTMIDTTFAPPTLFRPLELGFDLALHSATKFLNGHSDIVAGVTSGSAKLMKPIKTLVAHTGGSLDPHACFLFNRGLKTLELRMERHNKNAKALAEYLDSKSNVEFVNYPGLETHKYHSMAKEYFNDFGGVFSFKLKGNTETADHFINELELATSAPSLGGVECLVTRPATTSHSAMTSEQRTAAGVTDELIRFSVGIENTEDLLSDFERAFSKVF